MIVKDNGAGIEFERLEEIFLPLEESWKRNNETTPIYNRPYHGKFGSGRFKYLAIGEKILWSTIYEKDGKYYKYNISLDVARARQFEISSLEEVTEKKTGTTLTITDLTQKANTFCKKNEIVNELISGLLLDLKLSKDNLKIFVQDKEVIPENLVEVSKKFTYQVQDNNKIEADVECDIIVWKKDVTFVDHKHTFYYNSRNQYVDIKASGIPADTRLPAHTIIVKSNLFNNFNSLDNSFSALFSRIEKAYEPDALKLLAQAKNAHLSERLQNIIENPLYPFRRPAANAIEDAEKTAYNACLYNLLLNDSGVVSEKRSQMLKVVFPLLQRSFSGDYILSDNIDKLLELTSDESNKYNRMVNRIKLSKLIEKYGDLMHKKSFLKTLESLVYEDRFASHLEERTQLHKIVAEEAWIFGENFENEDIVTSDKALHTMIRQINKRKDLYFEDGESDKSLDSIEKFIKENKKDVDSCINKIPDLVLCKKERLNDGASYNHLIIELKKPKVPIDKKCRNQAMDIYSGILNASKKNGGIKISSTYKWRYYLVSSRISEDLISEYTKDGHLEEKSGGNYVIDCLTWREIIDRANERLNKKLDTINAEVEDSDCQELLSKYKNLFNVKIS